MYRKASYSANILFNALTLFGGVEPNIAWDVSMLYMYQLLRKHKI